MFIVFEGLDGSGKTTQARLLEAELRARGRRVELLVEPGTTALGRRVRRLLLEQTDLAITPRAELFLYEAARAQLTEERLKPALAAGRVVIADRYSLSSLAYQGYGRGLDLRRVRALDRWATDGLRPDLTLFLDIPPEESRRRQGAGYRHDRLEREELAFFRRVRRGYLREIRRLPGGVVLDGRLRPEVLFQQVRKHVETVLDLR